MVMAAVRDAGGATVRPWGRFKFVSRDPAGESDHLYFHRRTHRIGRNAAQCDIVLDMQFISQTHCVVTLDNVDGEPVVTLQDLSRNGVYVNEVRVGRSNTIALEPNITVHFTRPGLHTRTISPTVFKFELLQDGLAELRAAAHGSAPVDPAASPVPTTAAASSVSIRPTQDVVTVNTGTKRSSQDAELEPTQPMPVHATAAGKRPRTSDVVNSKDNGDDEDLRAAARVQQTNRELGEKLHECTSREAQLRKQLNDAEVEILSLTTKLEEREEQRKALTDALDRKTDVLAHLEQDKRTLEQALADASQALAAAQHRVELLELAIAHSEASEKKLQSELVRVTTQRDASFEQVRKLEAKVHELGRASRTNETAAALLETEYGDSDRATLAHSLTQALQIFEEIHAQVLRGQQLQATVRGATTAQSKEQLKRSAALEDSILSALPVSSSQTTPNSSQLSSEHSQLTPLLSSDVNSRDSSDDRSGVHAEAEAETMDTDAAVAYAPSSLSIAPVVLAAAHSEEHEAHDVDADDETHGTPRDRTQDSEDSMLSGHSSSKTPPPKPIRITSTLTVASASSADVSVSASAVAQAIVIVDDDENDDEAAAAAAEARDANGSEKEQPQPLGETVGDAAAAAVEPVHEEEDAVSGVQDDGAAAASITTDETPATATSAPTHEDVNDGDKMDEEEEQQQTTDAVAEAADDADGATSEPAAAPTATDNEQHVDEDAANVTQGNEDDDQEEEDEPLVAAPATTTKTMETPVGFSSDGVSAHPPHPQEHWLPTIEQDDDSPDSQTNAGEGTGIFDDETQLSQ